MNQYILYAFSLGMAFVTVELYEHFTKDKQLKRTCNEQSLSLEERIAVVKQSSRNFDERPTHHDDLSYISPPFDDRLMPLLSAFENDPDCIEAE